METTKTKGFESLKNYDKIIFVFIFSVILYIFAAIYNNVFVDIMSVANYLTWHIIFEFSSILVSFSLFAVTYFIYEESGSLRMIVLGCAFLTMAILDAFHTLAFKGMAEFFIINDSPNRATTLWVLSRLFGSLGFMAAVFIPSHIKSNIKKGIFSALTIFLTIVLFFIVTYLPDFFPTMILEEQGLTAIKIILEFIIIFITGITFIMVSKEHRRNNSKREYSFMIALILLIFSEFAFTNYGSVYDAFNYIGHIYKVIAYLILYKAIYIENVSMPYREMKKAKNQLERYSDNLNLLVQKRTNELEEMNKILINDIDSAKEMQRCLLPSQMLQNELVSFSAEYFAAERLSGDFYNVIRLDDENIAVYIGDVAGHGVSAAMLTVFAIQSIKPIKEEETSNNDIIEPGFVLKTIYKSFNKTNFNIETYIVMLYGIYNIKSKTFTYASAGINVAPYIIKRSGELVELDAKGFPICKLGEHMMPYYEDRKVDLESGDKIIFYSDGLIDAMNENGQMYGKDRLEDFLKKNYKLNSTELNKAIKNNLFNYMGKEENLRDDATFLIMEVN